MLENEYVPYIARHTQSHKQQPLFKADFKGDHKQKPLLKVGFKGDIY